MIVVEQKDQVPRQKVVNSNGKEDALPTNPTGTGIQTSAGNSSPNLNVFGNEMDIRKEIRATSLTKKIFNIENMKYKKLDL